MKVALPHTASGDGCPSHHGARPGPGRPGADWAPRGIPSLGATSALIRAGPAQISPTPRGASPRAGRAPPSALSLLSLLRCHAWRHAPGLARAQG